MLRLKKAIVEFAFLEMLLTCLLQERLLLMVTPRYFESVFVASCSLLFNYFYNNNRVE